MNRLIPVAAGLLAGICLPACSSSDDGELDQRLSDARAEDIVNVEGQHTDALLHKEGDLEIWVRSTHLEGRTVRFGEPEEEPVRGAVYMFSGNELLKAIPSGTAARSFGIRPDSIRTFPCGEMGVFVRVLSWGDHPEGWTGDISKLPVIMQLWHCDGDGCEKALEVAVTGFFGAEGPVSTRKELTVYQDSSYGTYVLLLKRRLDRRTERPTYLPAEVLESWTWHPGRKRLIEAGTEVRPAPTPATGPVDPNRRLLPVSTYDGYGYIDEQGGIVIPPQFILAGEFSEGLAPVCRDLHLADGSRRMKWEYIDKAGRTLISGPFGRARGFRAGLAAVEVGGRQGFINREGEFRVPPIHKYVGDFSEGRAAFHRDGKWGLYDTGGKVVLKPTYARIGRFSEGLATFEDADTGLTGYLDRSGNVAIPAELNPANAFSEGRAFAEKSGPRGALGGYIDVNGRFVTPRTFPAGGAFRNGLAVISAPEGPYYIDRSGVVVLRPQVDAAGNFSDGLATVRRNDRWGYMDRTGKVVILPQYDRAEAFKDGIAEVRKDGNQMYIDKAGTVIWPAELTNGSK